MTHAVVIGAGVIGASVAWRLAQSGAAVTVLEAMRVGSGTSAASFAWTNSNDKTPKAYHDLNVAGMRAHAALRDEFASAAWWHGGGNVEWITADAARAAHRAKVERLQSWGYAVEWLSPPQLMELEPDVIAEVAPEAVRIGVRPIPSDGHPAVGSVPGLEGYYEVVTHSGVTLAPFLGQAVADELVHGRREPLLEPFRPGRFRAVR